MLLGNGFKTFFIKSNPIFNNDPKSLLKNPPDCPNLYNWVFDAFILADELFAKALWSFQIYALVNSNFCVKLFSSLGSPTTFHKIFKLSSV